MVLRMQADDEGASKQSTVFYAADAGGAWATLATDLGQHFADLTVSGSTAYENAPASDRFDRSHPRTIGVVVAVDNTSSGALFRHSGGATELLLEINGGTGQLEATSNGAVVGALDLPLGDDPRTLVLAWVSRANPLTTGASNAVQSWLLCYDVANDALTKTTFVHPAKTSDSDRATWGGCSPATVTVLWFARAAQSASEILRDLGYYAPTPPSSACVLDRPPLPLDQLESARESDALYGPIPQWAAVHVRHALRRHWSPLANVVYRSQPELRRTNSGASAASYRLAPGSLGYQMGLGWLRAAPVPPGATHAWVRIHVRTWVTAGLPVPLGLRIYSLSRLPDAVAGGPLVVRQVGEVVARDDSGGGQWDVEALLELAIGEDGWTYLCPAFQFDPAGVSANDANARAQIRAFHAVPCVAE